MAKIFEWDVRKGTFIDSVQKNIGTATVFDFKKGSKGVFNHFLASGNSIVNFTNDSKYELDDKVSFVVAFRTSYNYTNVYPNGIIKKMNTTSPYNGFEFGIRENKMSMHSGGSYANNALYGNKTINDGQWHLAIGTFNADYSYIYVDNELDTKNSRGSLLDSSGYPLIIGSNYNLTRNFAGDILYIKVYNNILSAQERNDLYQEFLQSQITEKPVRGFELVKPTDLSYLKDTGLVAAYNMIPNGNTLVDISGNDRNGTLNGGLINTKDGLGFNGVNSYVNCGNTIGYGTEMTILGVINPDYTAGINIIGKDGGVSPKRGFYAEILNTGLIRVLFSQTGTTVQFYDSVTALGSKRKNTFAITFKGGVNSKIYVNGVLDKTEPTALTSIFNNSLDFNIGFNAILNNYYNGEIQDIRVYNRELTKQEIKDYHNSFVKPVILEDWSNYEVGNTMPNEWIINSGAFAIAETKTYKYLSCTSDGSIKINYPTTNTNVYASIDYYDGSNWTTYTGLLSSLDTTHSWLSVGDGYMTITLTTTTRVGSIKVYNGIKV